MDELKPCPFCGNIPQINEESLLSSLEFNKNYPNNGKDLYIKKRWYAVQCECCELNKRFPTSQEAVIAWNHRAEGDSQ